jgi:hypothetical protein
MNLGDPLSVLSTVYPALFKNSDLSPTGRLTRTDVGREKFHEPPRGVLSFLGDDGG